MEYSVAVAVGPVQSCSSNLTVYQVFRTCVCESVPLPKWLPGQMVKWRLKYK